MINGNLSELLDLGWMKDASLYYKGYIYLCQGFNDRETNLLKFAVYKWRVQNEDNLLYHSFVNSANELVDFSVVYENKDSEEDKLKMLFLSAKIFEVKSFWEVEPELAWLEEGKPIKICDTDYDIEKGKGSEFNADL